MGMFDWFSHRRAKQAAQTPDVKAQLRERQVIGQFQEDRAAAQMATFTEHERAEWDALSAGLSETAGKFLRKALAAAYDIPALRTFVDDIRAMSDADLMTYCQLTGAPDDSGVQQQWVMSCQATIAQAVRGMADPVYALWMHLDSGGFGNARVSDIQPDARSFLARDQKTMLESTPTVQGYVAGTAESLFDLVTGVSTLRGTSRTGFDLWDAQADATGLVHVPHDFAGIDATARQAVIETAAARVAEGKPVPLAVGDAGGVKHGVLITAVLPGPPKTFYIHDPGVGRAVARTEQQMLDDDLALPSGWTKIHFVYDPKPPPPT